jgi:predicted alpha/beta-fold hydrolase
LRAAHPGRRLYAVGFSLGGNALLKAMGEGGDNVPFAGALSVCAPLDLAICSAYLDDDAWFAYRQYLLFALRRMVKVKQRVLEGVIDVNRARASQTFRQYDDAVTAPIHGFTGVDDYYARSSARQYLAGVRRPTVILHAADDPFMPMAVVPRADELSPSVQLVVSSQGGHVGFVGRAADGGRGWWLDSWVVESVRRFEQGEEGLTSGL